MFLVVLYDGVWGLEGLNWIYKSPRSKTLIVEIDTSLQKMHDILYEELEIDPLKYDLKLEMCSFYMKGQLVPPEIINKESQLRVFLKMRAMYNVKHIIYTIVCEELEKPSNLEPTPPNLINVLLINYIFFNAVVIVDFLLLSTLSF